MPKPDKVLRSRPLKEVEAALSKLKRVVLFHPDPIVVELPPEYCVCRKEEYKGGKASNEMIQCDACLEWFHFECVGLKRQHKVGAGAWSCEWCRDPVDKLGYQRWRSNRKRPKRRHHLDTPRHRGAQPGQDAPRRYNVGPQWDDKVAEVKELARRAAVRKRRLTEAVEGLVAEGGHHVVDAEGMAGLELRAVDDGLVDEIVGAEILDPDEYDDSE